MAAALAHYFFLQLAAGLLVWSFACSLKSLGTGFRQMHLTIAFAALLLSLIGSDVPSTGTTIAAPVVLKHTGRIGEVLTYASAGLTLLATIAYSIRRFTTDGAPLLHALAAGFCLYTYVDALWSLGIMVTYPEWWGGWSLLFVSGGLLAATVSGGALLAMNVGHWYLINPLLGIGHLARIGRILFVALVARGALLVVSIVLTLRAAAAADPRATAAGLFLGYGLFEAMRLLVGYLPPLVLTWMALRTIAIRSTQSATGILYAVLVLVAIGEVMGQYLTLSRLIPW